MPTGSMPTGAMPTGAMPGGGSGSTASSALVTLLQNTTGTWSAAVLGAQSAAQLELSSGTSVMGIGGWSGSDAAPTLAQFQAYVAEGTVHYYISGGGMGGMGGNGGSEIATWVAAHFTSTTVGGSTVYDLTSAKS
jgi:hypothetical protein